MFVNQTDEAFDEVYRVKAESARVLDTMTRGLDLRLFVLCSSIASGLGGAGQTNYGWANSVLDQIASDRSDAKCVGHSVQWGAWDLDGDGMANKDVLSKMAKHGLGVVTPAIGLQILQTLIEVQG